MGAIVPFRAGITPAYAGKSHNLFGFMAHERDHPRVCGEKKKNRQSKKHLKGSPPRMRGKEKVRMDKNHSCGITPAYAGKSRGLPLNRCRLLGSPPRMRGKVLEADSRPVLRGITPAYAGKRLKRSRSTVPPVAIVPLFPSVCNKPVVSDGSPAGRDAPLFLPAENAVPASPAYNLRSL